LARVLPPSSPAPRPTHALQLGKKPLLWLRRLRHWVPLLLSPRQRQLDLLPLLLLLLAAAATAAAASCCRGLPLLVLPLLLPLLLLLLPLLLPLLPWRIPPLSHRATAPRAVPRRQAAHSAHRAGAPTRLRKLCARRAPPRAVLTAAAVRAPLA